MHALTALLVADHLDSLRLEAEIERRSRGPQSFEPSAVRRFAARGARRLSLSLSAVAGRLDPVDAVGRERHESRRARPLAA